MSQIGLRGLLFGQVPALGQLPGLGSSPEGTAPRVLGKPGTDMGRAPPLRGSALRLQHQAGLES